ncbi:MAG TPA: hypothetical protein VND93_05050 [Myxococcales bacterium]|jgi:hypothetical protein|nr:hypothetical protein [Myxococcales bacterium]
MAAVVGGAALGLTGCSHMDGGGGAGPRESLAMAPAGVEVTDFHQQCRTDMNCEAGYRCIVPAGASIRNGVCGTVVDQEGARLTRSSRAVPSCVVRSDCPLAFSCMKTSSLDGLCVK